MVVIGHKEMDSKFTICSIRYTNPNLIMRRYAGATGFDLIQVDFSSTQLLFIGPF